MAIDDLKVVMIKKELTSLGVRLPSGQSYSREQMVLLLGKELFAKGKIKRKDSGKVITKDILFVVNWAGQKIYIIIKPTGTNTNRLLHRKCDVRIFIHELQNFGKRTSEFSKVLQLVNKNQYKALSML